MIYIYISCIVVFSGGCNLARYPPMLVIVCGDVDKVVAYRLNRRLETRIKGRNIDVKSTSTFFNGKTTNAGCFVF